jgi:hypothetical protein
MNYLDRWIEDLLSGESLQLKGAMQVEGIRNQHLGPRWQYAQLEISVEPSPQFLVDIQLDNALIEELQKDKWLDWAIFGVLDILMFAAPRPLRNIRLIIVGARGDAINSSRMAFRQAGRDAGKKILKSIHKEK